MAELDLLDLLEGDHDFLGGGAMLDLQVEVVGGNPADALADVLAARRFNDQYHVLIRVAPDHAEEADELRFRRSAG